MTKKNNKKRTKQWYCIKYLDFYCALSGSYKVTDIYAYDWDITSVIENQRLCRNRILSYYSEKKYPTEHSVFDKIKAFEKSIKTSK